MTIPEFNKDRRAIRAFYPCCADDIEEPRMFLSQIVDEIIFCDLRKPKNWISHLRNKKLPKPLFMKGDVRVLIDNLPIIDVLFYRRDSCGMGGSSVYILGKKLLKQILDHFPNEGGLIVTDGSNSGSKIFKKMSRPNGYIRESWNWSFKPVSEPALFDTYGLHTIRVKKIEREKNE